jgi:hypothetical protein
VPHVWHDNTILVIADLLEPLETPRSPRFEPRRIARGPWFKIRQLTDVSRCKLQQYLSRNRHRAVPVLLASSVPAMSLLPLGKGGTGDGA